MELIGIRYDNLQVARLTIEQGRIARAETLIGADPTGLPYIAPGLVDVQVNGFDGQEFSAGDLTVEKVAKIVARHDAFGVTAFCPTVTTNSYEVLEHAVRTIATAADELSLSRRIPGIHVEGPYFSPEDGPRGAHPVQHCRPPDWDEFQRLQAAARGQIRILTMSCEFDSAPDFIAKVSATGVVIAIGHMNATGEQIRRAVDAGAKLSTHLGNGAHRQLRRHPNYIWDQLAEDRLQASLIVDGHHLPGEVVKCFVRAKTPERCILVSDVSGLAGLPAGVYQTDLCQLEILPDGRLVIAGQDQLLAGASLPLGVNVAGVMQFAGVDLAAAIAMGSTRPAALIGYEPGGLRPGDIADLVLFRLHGKPVALPQQFEVQSTVIAGKVAYAK